MTKPPLPLDQAAEVRADAELDTSVIDDYLRAHIPGLTGEISIRQFTGGSSNLTYLVSYGNKDLVLRKPPAGRKAKSAHDMDREYRITRALLPVFPYCPKTYSYCEDNSVLGEPFYVMERINGFILRRDIPSELSFNIADQHALCHSFINKLLELHNVDYHAVELDSWQKPGSYVQRQINGWNNRFVQSQTEHSPNGENIMRWLAEKMPKDSGQRLIHGDYKFDNLLLNPENINEIIGVLDWEMATIGDPFMDLGVTLGYWIEKDDPAELQALRAQPTQLQGMWTRRRLFDYYAEQMGTDNRLYDFYYVYGLFRLLVIIQQIYFRLYQRQGDNATRGFAETLHSLERGCLALIDRSNL